MEKALIEKMNRDMKEIQLLWKKEGNNETDKKRFLEKIENYTEIYKDFADFFSEYSMSVVSREDFSTVRSLINKLHKEIKKENFDRESIEKTVREFREIRITGTGQLFSDIVEKGRKDLKKLEEIIKSGNWEKETEFIKERHNHYSKIKIWFEADILRDLKLYDEIFDTMVNFDINAKQIESNKKPYIFVSED